VLTPVDDPRETSVEGTEARGAEDTRAFPEEVVFLMAAGRSAMGFLGAAFFAPVFFDAATGRTLVTRVGVRAADFGAPAFFLVAAFFGVTADGRRADAVFFAGAAAVRTADRFPATIARPVTGFLVAAVFRAVAEDFFAGEVFVVAFRAAGFVAAVFRTGAETFFAPCAAVRVIFLADAALRVVLVGDLRVTAAVREAERTDVLRADVPDLRGAGFLAIWGSSGLP
jgi:hypothetical protein